MKNNTTIERVCICNSTICRGDFLVMDYDYNVYEKTRECSSDGGFYRPLPPSSFPSSSSPSDTGYSRECNFSKTVK